MYHSTSKRNLDTFAFRNENHKARSKELIALLDRIIKFGSLSEISRVKIVLLQEEKELAKLHLMLVTKSQLFSEADFWTISDKYRELEKKTFEKTQIFSGLPNAMFQLKPKITTEKIYYVKKSDICVICR